jgi:gamma-glutamylcyclotransferase
MGPILYFAYGSNMAAERLSARIGSVSRVCVGALAAHRLAFHKPSLRDGSGKCDAARTDDPVDRVLGVVYALPEDVLAVLDRFEGCGMGYERRRARVRSLAGDPLETEIYVATRTDPSLRPFDWYKEHVLRGALAAGLPAEYVAEIEAVATLRDPDEQRRRRELAIYDPSA